MRTASPAYLTIVASLTIVACSNSTPAPPPTAPTATATTAVTPAEDAATPGGGGASPDPGAGPSATPSAPSAAPTAAASTCAKDTDCAWDDPCLPKRCVAASAAPTAAGCDESVPPEGTCVCFDRRCAYRPAATRSPVSVDQPCTSPPDCTMDAAAGTCVPGADPDAQPLGTPGPHCRCDGHEPRRCHYVWVESIPCAVDADCWVSHEGFAHPIARPRKLRGRRFRPCKDGEQAPVCRGGTCSLESYRC
jgi:hypothetical protein